MILKRFSLKPEAPSFDVALLCRVSDQQNLVAVATTEGSQVFQGLEQRDETVLVAVATTEGSQPGTALRNGIGLASDYRR
jgi:hypothetical protein